MRGDNLMDRFDGDPERGAKQHRCDSDGGDCLGLAVAVRMFFIRGNIGDHDAAPDDKGTDDVGEGFDAVGDKRLRMAEDTRDGLGGRQNSVHAQANQGGVDAAFKSALHAAALIARRTKVKRGRRFKVPRWRAEKW
jgi:hypothetical protein